MLLEFHAAADIHGQGIELDWTWQSSPAPSVPGSLRGTELRLVRRERTYPSSPDDGLIVLDLADLYVTAGQPWARIERARYLVPNAPAEGGLSQAEVAFYFAAAADTEPRQASIRYYDPIAATSQALWLVDVSRVLRAAAPAPPWGNEETIEIMIAPGGGAEQSAGQVIVSTAHADGTTPDRWQWIPAGGSAVSVAFDLVENQVLTTSGVATTPGSLHARLQIAHDGIVRSSAVLDEVLDADSGDWKQQVSLVDGGLSGETVYYYALFAPQPGAPAGPPASGTLITGQTWRASAMSTGYYGLGERMYRSLPALHIQYDAPPPGDPASGGPLRRFLDILGAALDLTRGQAEGLRSRHDVLTARDDLLPHLAEMIGWDLDRTEDVIAQRQDILFAPEVYTTVGTIPNACALVDRLTGWKCQVKEFVHNVLLTNAPEAIHLWEIWSAAHDGTAWSNLAPLSPTLPISGSTFEGRPAAAVDVGGVTWLFWHGNRATNGLSGREIWVQRLGGVDAVPRPATWNAPDQQPLATYTDEYPAAVADGGQIRLFWSSDREGSHDIWTRTFSGLPGSTPTRLTTHQADDLYPAAVRTGDGRIWLFWSSSRRGPTDIWAMVLDAGGWGLPQRMTTAERRHEMPAAAVDGAGRIWLFWSADLGDRHNLYWQQLDGGTWSAPQAATDGPWRDEAPAAAWHGGEMWLTWHSNRDGKWQVWQQRHDGTAWSAPEQVTNDVTGDKDPALIVDGTGTLQLFWRSQRRGRRTQSRTFDTGDAALLSAMRTFDDRVHYTYDTGRDDDSDWYARDTVGLYVTPNSEEEAILGGSRNPLDLVRPFLPIQVRAVLLVRPAVYKETVFTYDFPAVDPQRRIGEFFVDAQLAERVPTQADAYLDTAPDWAWMNTWSAATPGPRTVDVTQVPIVTRFRIWQPGVQAGG